MSVFDTVRTVLAVREYKAKEVPADVVRRIVEAARLTASSINGQPWHFIVVDEREMLKKLGSLARTGPYIAQVGLAVVVAIEDTKYAESDASRAIQSMILTAWDEGVGSNWVGFYGLEQVKAPLGIPDELQVIAIIPFGYPTRDLGAGKKKRKPLSEVVSKGKYGTPFQ